MLPRRPRWALFVVQTLIEPGAAPPKRAPEPIRGLATGAGPAPGSTEEKVLAEQDAGEKNAGGG
jgi:hypothetical protein